MIPHEETIPLTPLVAAMQGRDEDEQVLLSAAFLALNEDEQDILVGESTTKLLHQWVSEGLMPETHMSAIAKLIGLAALEDEISIVAIPELLTKIGISSENANQLGQAITQLIEPILVGRAEENIPDMSSVEMAPMSRATENGPQPIVPTQHSGQQVPPRNIIDLRKTQ